VRVAVFVALVVVAAGCSSHKQAVVTPSGSIGPLPVDRSNRAAVIAFAGRPNVERRGQQFDSPPYYALGYRCAKKSSLGRFPITAGGPACRTIFFLDPKTGTLETFFTSEPRYRERHGVRIGMASETAERLLHRRLSEGCETNIYLGALTISFAGGKVLRHLHVTGAHVDALVLHSRRHDAGVFDCL
jgi:hypothetical protein